MIEVTIFGKAYKVKCPAHEEQALRDSIALLQQEITTAKKSGGVSLREDVILMAALNISHKYLQLAPNTVDDNSEIK
jgi:cell division protein ZapA